MDRSSLSFKLTAAIIFSVLAASIPTSRCEGGEDEQFTECSRLLNCGGSFTNLSYPFWGGGRPQICGHWGFELDCVNDTFPVIQINDLGFRILKINQSTDTDVYRMRLARLDMWDGPCSSRVRLVNTTLNYPLFSYAQSGPGRVQNITLLYGCAEPVFAQGNGFVCDKGGTIYYANDSSVEGLKAVDLTTCQNVIRVPISGDESFGGNSANEAMGLDQLLNRGFEVEYDSNIKSDCENCEKSLHGVCGSDNTTTFPKFHCFCPGPTGCSLDSDLQSVARNIIVGSATGAIVILVTVCILICCYRKTKSCIKSMRIWKRMTKKERDLEAVIRGDGHLPVKRYKFKEVKKMTKSFKHKLGQGGYGDVFRGKLLDDGRLVAVKVLKASKGKGEEFINEVASISRTSHINIVTLLGFCLEGKKRALIYEFMPNGSLEKFIFKDTNVSQTNPRLEWDKLLQIASGIARGLEYLHRGCITRILHFDIKPHNILLDEEFCPKISDFGLAKLCSKKESVVSLMDARGTIGYIAPEVVSKNFGGVSTKSDVYSYGMMILEMVGGRKNMKIGVRNPSQVYFPDWIYKHLELGSKLELWVEMSSAENEIARKMILVGLWCIQTKPSDRPTMSKVIEMLEGNLQALQIPPKPSVFSSRSPERLPAEALLTESLNSFGP